MFEYFLVPTLEGHGSGTTALVKRLLTHGALPVCARVSQAYQHATRLSFLGFSWLSGITSARPGSVPVAVPGRSVGLEVSRNSSFIVCSITNQKFWWVSLSHLDAQVVALSGELWIWLKIDQRISISFRQLIYHFRWKLNFEMHPEAQIRNRRFSFSVLWPSDS